MRVAILGTALLTAVTAGAVQPAAAAAADYTVKTSELKLDPGTRGVTPVVISTTEGWHLNAEAPLWLKLTAPDGLTLAKTKMERGDLAESTKDRARFDVAMTAATAPGKRMLDGELFFVLCQDQACRPIKTKVSVPIEVVARGTAASTAVTAKPAKSKAETAAAASPTKKTTRKK